ncbi:MAG: mannose-6-phosphate isomerase [Epulopiscium sp.]|nr:type I phosphomannose isomerase catalytic subunit [Defluviitalea raffinosedens]MBZ4667211.1 mannose-6-phosphate isomerase, class [Defluviitaleaceae bacterium]MDK2787240.1 mannose-6-phosphate isomerase [Candidatus Epulonipiscium sp.]HHW67623.1 class I mannose-6-phosphate isomerase [Candidatus Epulonipiscium sp.]
MLYPLKLDPVYKEPIWGGKKLREIFDKDIPSDTTGESWEIACHENGTSIVANGPLKGKSLKEVIDDYGVEALGTKIGEEGKKKFPLLVKIIDASDRLSVQVHPEDEYAKEHEGELGKTEMWIVLDAKPGAQLVYGVKPGVTREMFEESIKKGTLENLLNFVDVKKGDVFFIPAGTLHAIGEGLLIAEIQQNSDTTYRVYDWNRVDSSGKPRELHIQKALDVTILSDCIGHEKVEGTVTKEGENIRHHLVSCKYFVTEILEIQKESKEPLNGDKFDLLMAIEGNGVIEYREGAVPFKAGDSFFMPASIGDYSIAGQCKVIKTYVPVR